MNKTLLDALTDAVLGMGLTEDDVLPLGELADCLVALDLDRDGGEVNQMSKRNEMPRRRDAEER